MFHLPKRLALVIILFFLILGLFPVRYAHAGAFDFDLDKWSENKAKCEEQAAKTGKECLNVDRSTGYNFPLGMAVVTDSIIPISQSNQPRATSALSNLIAVIYQNPPASAQAYTYDLLANAGFLAKTAQAQGIGFAGLTPILPLWKAARNLAYSVLIIIIVAIGFMIIFRMKIDPKTVISVQSAIPKIIITLILITFSYPIAGFLIDVMYLLIFIVIQVMSNAVPADQLAIGAGFVKDFANQQAEFTQSGFGGWWKLATSVFSFGLFPAFFQQMFGGSSINSGGGIVGIVAGGLLAHAIQLGATFAGGAVTLALPLIIVLVIGLGLLFTLIRLTMLLVNSYIQLLIAIILGPVLLLREAIPGQSAFSEWIMNIMANLVVYPATIGVIYLSWILTVVMWNGSLWGPPLTPVGGGGDIGGKGNPLAVMLGLGVMFLAPSLVASIKKIFHPKPALPITAATAFAPATGAISTGASTMQSFYYLEQVIKHGTLGGIINQFTGAHKGPGQE